MNTATVREHPCERAHALGLSILRLSRLAGVDATRLYRNATLKGDEAERLERVLRDAELEASLAGSP